MKHIQNKIKKVVTLLFKERRFLRADKWLWRTPLILASVTFVQILVLNTSDLVRTYVYNIVTQYPADSINRLEVSVGLLIAAVAMYLFIDYIQHSLPFEQEESRIEYGVRHHVKVVVLPRIRYNWRRSVCGISYGCLGLILLSFTLASVLTPTEVRAYAPNEFVTTWTTENPNLSDSKTITIQGRFGTNFQIDWGDGVVTDESTAANPPYGNRTHTYATDGIKTIKISGDFTGLQFADRPYNNRNVTQLISVEQWGTIEWASMDYAFTGAKNLVINALDTPDLSNAVSMNYTFSGNTNFNSNIDNWDVSTIESMVGVFCGASNFNQPLNNWSVGNVTTMYQMFGTMTYPDSGYDYCNTYANNGTVFNQPLTSWDVSSVTDMRGMFANNGGFNQDINTWDTTSLTKIYSMFYEASDFNQPLNNWNVSNVINMNLMFASAESFNKDIGSWNVSNVTNMRHAFYNASDFNVDISNWDVSGVTDMAYMFRDASSFDIDIEGWNVSNVINMAFMFYGASAFNQPLNSWDVSSVTYMNYMFGGAATFNQPLNNWNVSSVTNMTGMFMGYDSTFNQPLNNWNVSNVTDMRTMFERSRYFNQPLNNWNVSSVTNMRSMFSESRAFNQPLNNWDVSSVTDMTNMFTSSGLLDPNYDLMLNSWSTLTLKDNVTLDSRATYCDSELARSSMIENFNWVINDDGKWCAADFSIITEALPNPARVNQLYDERIVASGAYMNSTPKYTITSGVLPDGITQEGDRFYGYPTEAGEWIFTIKAERHPDSAAYSPYYSATRTYTIIVEPSDTPPPFETFSDPFVTISSVTKVSSESSTATVVGRGPPNKLINIYVDDIKIGGTTSNVNGDWTYKAEGLSKRQYNFKAKWEPGKEVAFVPSWDGEGFDGDFNNVFTQLLVMDSQDNAVVKTIDMPQGFLGVDSQVNSQGTKVYILGSYTDKSVARVLEFDVVTGVMRNMGDFDTTNGIASMSISRDGSFVYILTNTDVHIIDVSQGTSRRIEVILPGSDDSLRYAIYTSRMSADDTGGRLFLAHSGLDQGGVGFYKAFSSIDLQTGVVTTTNLGSGSVKEQLNSVFLANHKVYVVFASGDVKVLNSADLSVLQSFNMDLSNVEDAEADYYSSESVMSSVLDSSSGRLYLSVRKQAGSLSDSQDRVVTSTIKTLDTQSGEIISRLAASTGLGMTLSKDGSDLFMYEYNEEGDSGVSSFNTSSGSMTRLLQLEGPFAFYVAYYSKGGFINNIVPPYSAAVLSAGETVGAPILPPFIGPNDSTENVNKPRPQSSSARSSKDSTKPPVSPDILLEPFRKFLPTKMKNSEDINSRQVSKLTAVYMPWLLIILLLTLTSIYLIQSLIQLKFIAKTRSLSEKQKLLNHEKQSLLALASHHLRTPLTILSAGTGMLKVDDSTKRSISSEVQHLKQTIEALVGQIESLGGVDTKQQFAQSFAGKTVLRQPLFILPVILAAIPLLVINGVSVIASPSGATFARSVTQLLALLIAAALLYVAFNFKNQKRQAREGEAKILEHQTQLDQERNIFLLDVSNKLVPEVVKMGSAIPTDIDSKAVGFMKEGLRQLEDLAQKFILISQLGNHQLQQKAIDIQLTDVIKSASATNESLSQSLEVNIPITTHVKQPEFLLRTVIASLLKNATEHASSGNIVKVSSSQDNNNVLLHFRDYGEGISPERLDYLFKPLSRVENTDDFTHQGIGLSLYIDRLIMHYLGGDISAESKQGEGTTMTVTVPIS